MKINIDNGKKRRFKAGKKEKDIAFSLSRSGAQMTFKNGEVQPTKKLKIKMDSDWYEIGDVLNKTRYYTTVRLIPTTPGK